MRRSAILVVLLCLVIFWLVLVVYLAGSPSPAQDRVSRIHTGIVPVTGPEEPELFSLEETNRLAISFLLDSPNESSAKDICYIMGRDVDENGNAPSWLYGVRHPLGTALLVYDKSGWNVVPWSGTLPDQKLEPDTFVPLNRLFSTNRDLIGTGAGLQRQVEVYNNTCRISVSDTKEMHVYSFNATTGVLIQPYER